MKHYMVVAVESPDDGLISEMIEAAVEVYNNRTDADELALMHGVCGLPTIDAARSALTECNWALTHAEVVA